MTIRSINTSGLPQGVLTPMGDLLFAASEPGAWYDPSDLSTLFQDSAGTTPVTAVEQPVGLMLDKSGRGNHASQATSTKRPKYSRRVNLTQNAHKIANWTDGNNADYADYFGPGIDGVLLQQKVGVDSPNTSVYSAAKANDVFSVSFLVDIGPSTPGSISFKLLRYYTGTPYAGVTLTRDSRVLIDSTFGTGSVLSSSMTNVSGDIFKISFTGKIGTDSDNGELKLYASTSAVLAQVFILGKLQITTAADAHLPYQRVNTATDYDADPNKFPAYLACDGIDDAMQTGNIDFTGTDKMTVWAGVFKSDAATGTQYVAFSNGDAFNGFSVYASSNRWVGYSSGASGFSSALDPLSIANTQNSVIAVSADQIAPYVRLRRDYQQVAASTAAQGGGGYGDRPLNIGSRNGTSNYFNGRIYQLIVRGAQSSKSQIEATELYIKQKMRMP